MTPLAIPYPSEVFTPYILEPTGEFLSAWGDAVLFPLAHWMAWITIILSSIMIIRKIWWEFATGGPENRVQAEVAARHQEEARQDHIRERSGGISG